MNTPCSKGTFTALGLGILAIAWNGLPAQAEAVSSDLHTTAPNTVSNTAILESDSTDLIIAQTISPGTATRSGSSYVGVGGNIGLSGRTALGNGNFAVFSKVGVTDNVSVRPAAIVGNRATFLLPVTVDFPTAAATGDGRLSIAPYVGGGAVLSTGRDGRLRPMVTGGVDAPISDSLTATAGVNVGFLRRTEVGLQLGLGYNF
uniref:hypothetical protein n=1 Tax=Trichocoleus desertorum TaxID=1481672 RepID=UPI0025B62654|nr:hypothetical protein [Trichocoleus desertorum]